MAITSHKLIGGASKEVIQGGKYKESGSKGTTDLVGGTVQSTNTGPVNTAIPGVTVITYTLTEYDSLGVATGVVDSTVTRTVTVLAPAGEVDTTFDLGDEDRKGNDTSGTTFDAIVDAARAGTAPSHTSAAYFSETALDPYEVKHSK